MDEPSGLRDSVHWTRAVRTLRVGYVALAVAIAGLVMLLVGATPWVLAAGVCAWLASVAIILVNFLWARRELGTTRPELWSMRMMLVKDSWRTSATAHR